MSHISVFSLKSKAVKIAAIILIAVLLALLLRWLFAPRGYDMTKAEDRVAYLESLGWKVDESTEKRKEVVIPQVLEGVMADYNILQRSQGFDLNKHLGERVAQYSYSVTNYPDGSDNIVATIYVQGKKVIAGDIHSCALDGFMHGLVRDEKSQ